jgi:hypothetical protein
MVHQLVAVAIGCFLEGECPGGPKPLSLPLAPVA